jgi:hypothetical protein
MSEWQGVNMLRNIQPTRGVNMLRNIHQEEYHSIKTYQEEYEDYIVKHGFVKHKE